jgi:hypothetical protein
MASAAISAGARKAGGKVDGAESESLSWLHTAKDIDLVRSDAPPEIRMTAFASARQALKKLLTGGLSSEFEVAKEIALSLQAEHKGTWHVVTGSSFGAKVTHEAGTLIMFSSGGTGFMVFRHG